MANRVEIVYSIKELLKEHTDDSLLSSRHILYLFNTYRAKYLRQLYSDRAKEFDSSATQTLCLDMESVSKGTCGIKVPCNIRRSKVKLPSLLGVRSRSSLISVRPAIVGTASFEIIKSGDANSCLEDKYFSSSVFVEDGYIYLVGKQPSVNLIKCIRVTAIFDDPAKLSDFSNCCGCADTLIPVIDDTTEYPIPAHLLPLISDEVLKNYITTLPIQRDTDNDSVPDIVRK